MDKKKERAEMRRKNRERVYSELDQEKKEPLTEEERVRIECIKAQIRQQLKEEGLY